jgi:hypothetical protein
MDHFSRDDLRALVAARPGPCASLLMPTTRGQSHEDKGRWKNLLREAEDRLKEHKLRAPDVAGLLAPARALLDRSDFWQNVPRGGVAAFVAPGWDRAFRLPLPLPEKVLVADRFHVKPLLPLLVAEDRFFVLTLSQKKVRLLRCTPFTAEEMNIEGVPESIDEALFNTDAGETRSHLNHPPHSLRDGKSLEVLRGRGSRTESGKDGLLPFLQRVDRGLHRYLHGETTPLVLACVDYLVPIFREANHYPHLIDAVINEHPDRMSPAELRDKAWALVRPHFERDRDRLAALYRQLAGTGRASDNLTEVLPAAHRGQVQYLFVDLAREAWGTFDPDAGKTEVHDRMRNGDQDLLNLAVTFALSHKTTVYSVPPEPVADGRSGLAAIYWLPLGQRGTSGGGAQSGVKVGAG